VGLRLANIVVRIVALHPRIPFPWIETWTLIAGAAGLGACVDRRVIADSPKLEWLEFQL